MTELLSVEQRHRTAAADLLDVISDLLDHNGIGQVADLIRDGEYDEHEATIAFARFEQSIPPTQGVVEALREAEFLIARIDELDWSDPDSLEREWHGHVAPPLSRLRALLASIGEEVA